jgi:hypothetical protein
MAARRKLTEISPKLNLACTAEVSPPSLYRPVVPVRKASGWRDKHEDPLRTVAHGGERGYLQ